MAVVSSEARERAREAVRNPKLCKNHVYRGNTETERPRVRVRICQHCYDITDRRPIVGVCACGKRYVAEVVPRATATIGSAAQACVDGVGLRA